jgi:hypothetical protein
MLEYKRIIVGLTLCARFGESKCLTEEMPKGVNTAKNTLFNCAFMIIF